MKQLGMKKAHREHVIRNMATSLLLFESITTTESKAKELKSYIDRIISKAKKNDLHSRRQVEAILFDKNATKKLFSELIVRYEGRNSGFTKSYRVGSRIGDNASKMRLDLVDMKKFVKTEDTPKSEKKDAKVASEVKTEKKVKESVKKS